MEGDTMEASALVKPLSGIELTNLTYALVVVASFFGLSSLYLAIKLQRLSALYRKMMQGADGQSIEQMMLGRISEIEELKQAVADLQAKHQSLSEDSLNHIQRMGLIRFNAFDNTGSDLSFALAMTDAARNGFVLSGIYGREESRVYAKPIVDGESTYMLTKEEKQALQAAAKKENK